MDWAAMQLRVCIAIGVQLSAKQRIAPEQAGMPR